MYNTWASFHSIQHKLWVLFRTASLVLHGEVFIMENRKETMPRPGFYMKPSGNKKISYIDNILYISMGDSKRQR